MKLSARELLIFGGKFLGALLILALLWPFIAGAYSHLLAALVGWWMPNAEIQASADQIEIHLAPIRTFVTMGAIVFNLLLLTALMVATPRLGGLRRLKLMAMALLFQVGFHFLDIVLSVGANRAAATSNNSGLYVLASLVGGVGEQASPIIIWALLTFRYWFPKPAAASAMRLTEARNRNALCPCGSGKKYKHCCER